MDAQPKAPTIDRVLLSMRAEQEQLAHTIELYNTSQKDAQKQQGQLKTDLGVLEKAVADLLKTRVQGHTASQLASTTLEDFDVQKRIAELGEAIKNEMKTTIERVDGNIRANESEVDQATEALERVLHEQARLQRYVDRLTAKCTKALDALKQFPANLRDSITRIQKLATDLRSTATTGPGRKVYVLYLELDDERTSLDKRLSDDYERQLVDAYMQAHEELCKRRSELEAKREDVVAKQGALDQAIRVLAQSRDEREAQLAQLYLAQEQPSANAAGRA